VHVTAGHVPPSADQLVLERLHRRQQAVERAALEDSAVKRGTVPEVPQLVRAGSVGRGTRDDGVKPVLISDQ
jgi:hypothetical protein